MSGAAAAAAAAAAGEGGRPAAPAWFEGQGEGTPVEVAAEVVERSDLPVLVLEDEEVHAIADAKSAMGTAEIDGEHYLKLPPARIDLKPPDWAKIPPAPFRFPRGVDVAFVRVRGNITAAKQKGDRILVIWGLSDGDEKLAYGRAMGDSNRAITELAKQSVRAVDGVAADWSGTPGPGSVDLLWRELGGKGRGQLIRLYTQLHVYDAKEQADFFENCVVLVATG
jgi:hypothetical protein